MPSTPGDKVKYRRLRAQGVDHKEAVARSAAALGGDFGGMPRAVVDMVGTKVHSDTVAGVYMIPSFSSVIVNEDSKTFELKADNTGLVLKKPGLYFVQAELSCELSADYGTTATGPTLSKSPAMAVYFKVGAHGGRSQQIPIWGPGQSLQATLEFLRRVPDVSTVEILHSSHRGTAGSTTWSYGRLQVHRIGD